MTKVERVLFKLGEQRRATELRGFKRARRGIEN